MSFYILSSRCFLAYKLYKVLNFAKTSTKSKALSELFSKSSDWSNQSCGALFFYNALFLLRAELHNYIEKSNRGL